MKTYPLVRFDFDKLPKKYWKDYPFSIYDHFVLLGEIEQMAGHCIVVNCKTGQLHVGYHTENFTKLTDEEV
jgi:hypothetical protein